MLARSGRLLLPLVCLFASGCAKGVGYAVDTFTVTGAPVAGKLFSGTAPVAGAHVYLMAVSATGYGKSSVSLLEGGSTGFADATGTYVVTAADGSFTIPGTYSCSAQTSAYLYASGGDSGSGPNSIATELAAIGPCPQVGAAMPPVIVNEVTTVAMSFALAGFATDALHVASSGTPLALTGLANAFVNASHLASISTGLAQSVLPSGAATAPQATINTLANVLSACIHSPGPASSPCQFLLGYAGGAPPSTDTASAAIAIAHSPAAAVSTLLAQQSVKPPFTPFLTVAPNDFSLGLVFTGGGIDETNGMAVDRMGNVWSTNLTSPVVTEISSAGVFLSGPSGYPAGLYGAGPVAVDTAGNVWIGNGANTLNGPGSIVKLSSNGQVLSGPNGYVGNGIRTPQGLAIDANNNVWIADTANDNVVLLSSSGQVLSGLKGFSGGGINLPYKLAIDASNNVWITNSAAYAYSISELSNSGAALTPSNGIFGLGFSGADDLAIDHSGNVWGTADGLNAQVSKISPSGVILSGPGFVGGGISAANGSLQTGTGGGGETIAIDGDGNAWVPLDVMQQVVELSNAGIPLSGHDGYGGGIARFPQHIVIDGSGDVWVANATLTLSTMRGIPSVYTWKITELIGVAAPVVTPLAAGVQQKQLGARP